MFYCLLYTVDNLLQRSTSRHGSKPLKVMVLHNTLVAHQTFALRCIDWLQTVINKTGEISFNFICLVGSLWNPTPLDFTKSILARKGLEFGLVLTTLNH